MNTENLFLRHNNFKALGIADDEKVYLRAIHPENHPQTKNLEFIVSEINYECLQALQRKGYGLYIVVNQGGHKDKDITAARAIFYEHDDLSKADQKILWQKLSLPEPSFQVDTGGKSIHNFWVFDQPHPDIKAWRQLQVDLLAYANADQKIKNPSRVMRLAGSRYCKGDNPDAVATIITQSDKRYSFDDLRDKIPSQKSAIPMRGDNRANGHHHTSKRIPLERLLSKEHQDWVKRGVDEGSRNDSGYALAVDAIGVELRAPSLGIAVDGTARDLLWQYGSQCKPPIDERELEKIYKSAESANPSPCLDDELLLKIASKWDTESAPGASAKQPIAKQQSKDSDGSDEKESTDAFKQMMEIVKAEAECWISSDDTPYADVVIDGIRKTWPIESRHFKRWISTRVYDKHQKGVSSEAIEKVRNVLCGIADSKGPQREAYLRIAEHEGSIYIDMADERWQVIEVSKQGWRVIQSVDCPVRFVRASSQLPLPMPEHGGDISQLWRLLPVAPDSRPLLLGWLISCFTTTGAKPILVFSGPKGSGKSEAATTLKMLTDPGKAAMMPSVGDSRNMASAAMSRWLMIYDNLTHLTVEQQDALCRASTGAGFSHRSLFTDLDETFAEYKRPQILTSVDLVPSRSDLLDRCVLVQLERIPEAYRIPIHQLARERAEMIPRLLGSLLSALSGGLQRMDSHLERLPRMADFALMATACEPGLGLQHGEFMRAYAANIETAVQTAVESNPIAAAIMAVMEDCTQWQGSTQDLLDRMKQKSPSPKVQKLDPRRLGHAMKGSLKADLDAVGIEVDDYKTKTGKQWIIREVDTPDKVAKTSSSSSPSSLLALGKAFTGDDVGDDVESPPHIVTTSSPLEPALGKGSDDGDDDDDVNGTLRQPCDDDVDPYPVGCLIEFSRTAAKPQRAQVIPKPANWAGSTEPGVFVRDRDGQPLLVPINRIKRKSCRRGENQ